MKNALDVRPTFKLNNDSLLARTAPTGRHRVALQVAIPSGGVHNSEPEQEDRAPLSEFVVWMIFLAYLAVILAVTCLLWAHFTSS